MLVDRQFPKETITDESRVWEQLVAPVLHLPRNVFSICHHGFTEMLNNVIDYANCKTVVIRCDQDAGTTIIDIDDDGVRSVCETAHVLRA